MTNKLPIEAIIVGEFEKNSKEVVRVTLQQRNGFDLVNVRVFYLDIKDGQYKPGKDGISVRIEQFSRLAGLLAAAGEKLNELGLL